MTSTINATKAVQTAQDEFLSAVRQNQQAILDSVSAWAKAVHEIVPTGPTIAAFPESETVVDNAFDFAHKLLDAQRDFARGMIAATSPPETQRRPATASKS
jgi:hypothetical protein